VFLIAHLYLTTAGHTPTSHIKAMITGWEEVDAEE
jgi:thiosulfate reductase cytochrome b subunit